MQGKKSWCIPKSRKISLRLSVLPILGKTMYTFPGQQFPPVQTKLGHNDSEAEFQHSFQEFF